MYPHVGLFIDGQWTPAAGGATLEVRNPATEEVIGTVARAGRADLDRALAAAARGFKAWRRVSAFERSKILRRAAGLMRARAGEIAGLLSLERGKPRAEALIEVTASADLIDWFAEEGRRTYGRIFPALVRHDSLSLSGWRRLALPAAPAHPYGCLQQQKGGAWPKNRP